MSNDSNLLELAYAVKDLVKSNRDAFLNQLKSFRKGNDQWHERQRLEIKHRNHLDKEIKKSNDQLDILLARHKHNLGEDHYHYVPTREQIGAEQVLNLLKKPKRCNLGDDHVPQIYGPSLASTRRSSPWQDCICEVEKGTIDPDYWCIRKDFHREPDLSPSELTCLCYVRLSILHDMCFQDEPGFIPLTRGILDGGYVIKLDETWKVMCKDSMWCYRLREALEAVRTDLDESLKTDNKESTEVNTSPMPAVSPQEKIAHNTAYFIDQSTHNTANINVQSTNIRTDIDAREQIVNIHKSPEKKHKKTVKKAKSSKPTDEKKFETWKDAPEDTGFVLLYKSQNTRLILHHNGKHADLQLGSNGRPLLLMKALAEHSMRSSQEIQELCETTTPAYTLVRRANEA